MFFLSPGLLLFTPQTVSAKDTCPWINEATASGALGGPVTFSVERPNPKKDDATCEFIRKDGSTITGLRIEVETMGGPPGTFSAYAARCGTNGVALQAIGNEAVACSLGDKKKAWISEQVVGRVRNHQFTVRFSSNGKSADRDLLREKARKMAEQVAGFLF